MIPFSPRGSSERANAGRGRPPFLGTAGAARGEPSARAEGMVPAIPGPGALAISGLRPDGVAGGELSFWSGGLEAAKGLAFARAGGIAVRAGEGFGAGAPLSSAATSAGGAALAAGFWARILVLSTNGPQLISSTGLTSQALTLWPLTKTPAEALSWTATLPLWK